MRRIALVHVLVAVFATADIAKGGIRTLHSANCKIAKTTAAVPPSFRLKINSRLSATKLAFYKKIAKGDSVPGNTADSAESTR